MEKVVPYIANFSSPTSGKLLHVKHPTNDLFLTEICLDLSCFLRQSEENSLERNSRDVLHDTPEPEERAGERSETAENEALCPLARRESEENTRKRKRTVPRGEPELQQEETLAKRTRTYVNVVKAESNTEPEKGTRTEIGANHVKREKGDVTAIKSKKRMDGDQKKMLRARYRIGKLLGKGNFGSVYAAIRKSDRRKVAIKIARKDENDAFVTLPGDTSKLPLEVALLELVSKTPHCSHVIQLLEWYETPSYFMLVLERPKHCTDLWTFCKRHPKRCLSEHQAKIIMKQLLSAALHCHKRGVFHRDIKEQNILLNAETLEVKLIDFGCGALLQDAPYSEYAGTEFYLPPEVYLNDTYDAEPATVWSLGVLLYNILCGRLPFNSSTDIIKNLRLPVRMPELIRDLIQKCLEADPDKRAKLDDIIAHKWLI